MPDKFSDLASGDMFNTKAARYVKTGEAEAIVVMSGVFKIGTFHHFEPDNEVVILYSRNRS